MDKICIEDLEIFANHGVFEHEKINGQTFYVNAVLYTDTEKAGITDNLELSTDYGSVCGLIKKIMTENTYDLIETAAQAVAVGILSNFSKIRSADIEIRKPFAPVEMNFRSISVKINRGWHTALIALGSNIGDSREYIETAVKRISDSGYFRNVKASDLIVTKPYGYEEQEDFLNGVLVCETLYSPEGLLDFLHVIENVAERKREIHWGPRTLDLDIIFYDNEIISEPELIIPHPDMQNRTFVLEPAMQLVPYYRHPVLNRTIKELYEELKNNG